MLIYVFSNVSSVYVLEPLYFILSIILLSCNVYSYQNTSKKIESIRNINCAFELYILKI
jgi:hypothetical protein